MPRNTERAFGLFNDSFPPILDGVTLTVQNYARWLTEEGHRTCVVTPWNPVRPTIDGFELYRYLSLPIFNRRPYRYGYPRLDPMIWHHMRRVPFKLVHAHCPFSSGRIALYAARYHRVPLVATFHSKYRSDLDHSLPRWIIGHVMKRILDFFNAADEVWIPQPSVEETIREYGYRGRLTVVDNGIDLAGDDNIPLRDMKSKARRELGIPADEMTLLFVGQHILEKGVETIIRAVALLRDLPMKMHFIGNGYAVPVMKGLIDRLGVGGNVVMHGILSDRNTLGRWYAAADLFIFPSFYDNAPLVVREAASMGTPAILLRGSTAAEVITDRHNGFIADNTPDSYAATIRHLHSHPAEIGRAAIGARASLSRQWKDVVEEVTGRYNEIIARYDKDR